jgi:hypothetical protein
MTDIAHPIPTEPAITDKSHNHAATGENQTPAPGQQRLTFKEWQRAALKTAQFPEHAEDFGDL